MLVWIMGVSGCARCGAPLEALDAGVSLPDAVEASTPGGPEAGAGLGVAGGAPSNDEGGPVQLEVGEGMTDSGAADAGLDAAEDAAETESPTLVFVGREASPHVSRSAYAVSLDEPTKVRRLHAEGEPFATYSLLRYGASSDVLELNARGFAAERYRHRVHACREDDCEPPTFEPQAVGPSGCRAETTYSANGLAAFGEFNCPHDRTLRWYDRTEDYASQDVAESAREVAFLPDGRSLLYMAGTALMGFDPDSGSSTVLADDTFGYALAGSRLAIGYADRVDLFEIRAGDLSLHPAGQYTPEHRLWGDWYVAHSDAALLVRNGLYPAGADDHEWIVAVAWDGSVATRVCDRHDQLCEAVICDDKVLGETADSVSFWDLAGWPEAPSPVAVSTDRAMAGNSVHFSPECSHATYRQSPSTNGDGFVLVDLRSGAHGQVPAYPILLAHELLMFGGSAVTLHRIGPGATLQEPPLLDYRDPALRVSHPEVSPDRQHVLLEGDLDGSGMAPYVLSAADPTTRRLVDEQGELAEVAFSPDGRSLALASATGTDATGPQHNRLREYDLATLEMHWQAEAPSLPGPRVDDLVRIPGQRRVLFRAFLWPEVRSELLAVHLDGPSAPVDYTGDLAGGPEVWSVSPDGTRLAVASGAGVFLRSLHPGPREAPYASYLGGGSSRLLGHTEHGALFEHWSSEALLWLDAETSETREVLPPPGEEVYRRIFPHVDPEPGLHYVVEEFLWEEPYHRLRLLEPPIGGPPSVRELGTASSYRVTDDGHFLLFRQDGSTRVVDLRSGENTLLRFEHDGPEFSDTMWNRLHTSHGRDHDGHLALGNHTPDGTYLFLFDLEASVLERSVPLPSDSLVAIAPDLSFALVCAWSANPERIERVSLVGGDTQTVANVSVPANYNSCGSPKLSPRGDWVTFTTPEGFFVVPSTGDSSPVLLGAEVEGGQFDDDEQHFAAFDHDAKAVHVWTTDDWSAPPVEIRAEGVDDAGPYVWVD